MKDHRVQKPNTDDIDTANSVRVPTVLRRSLRGRERPAKGKRTALSRSRWIADPRIKSSRFTATRVSARPGPAKKDIAFVTHFIEQPRGIDSIGEHFNRMTQLGLGFERDIAGSHDDGGMIRRRPFQPLVFQMPGFLGRLGRRVAEAPPQFASEILDDGTRRHPSNGASRACAVVSRLRFDTLIIIRRIARGMRQVAVVTGIENPLAGLPRGAADAHSPAHRAVLPGDLAFHP